MCSPEVTVFPPLLTVQIVPLLRVIVVRPKELCSAA